MYGLGSSLLFQVSIRVSDVHLLIACTRDFNDICHSILPAWFVDLFCWDTIYFDSNCCTYLDRDISILLNAIFTA